VDGYEVAFRFVNESGNTSRTAPFGLDIVHLETVRFVEIVFAGQGQVSISVFSELTEEVAALQESFIGSWRVVSAGWAISETAPLFTEGSIVTIDRILSNPDIAIGAAMSNTSIDLAIIENLWANPTFEGEGRIGEDGRLTIAHFSIASANGSEMAVLERVD
jgi:hypothetical protein